MQWGPRFPGPARFKAFPDVLGDFDAEYFDHVYWSLTVELAFYLNAATLLLLKLHRQRLKFVLFWICSACLWALFKQGVENEARDWFAMLFAVDYAPFFAIGILFFDASKVGWSKKSTALLAAVVATATILKGVEGFVVASIIVTLFALAMRERLTFLVSKVTLWLGTISFAVYLTHRNLGYNLMDYLHHQGVGPIMGVTITIISVLVLATALTYWIEKPVLAGIRSSYGLATRTKKAA